MGRLRPTILLGPLAGRGDKARAEHIGAAAREARRAARIAELRDRIASLGAEIEAHDAGIAEVDRRRAALDTELDALPPVDALASAVDALRVALALEAEHVRAHEQASVAARTAADAEIVADAARREHAAAHGIAALLDEAALDGLGDAAAELPGAGAAVGSAWALAEREAQAATAVATRLSEAQRVAGEQDRRARDEQAESGRLSAEHAAREDALGATGEELRKRHAEVTAALQATRATRREAGDAAQEAQIAVAGLQRDADTRAREHEATRARREEASIGFRQLAAQAGILQMVLGDAAPVDDGRAAAWTFTRTLEVARALPQDLLSVRSTTGELGIEVQRGVQLLDRELAEADMGAYATRGDDELLLVHVTEGGGEQSLAEILETLTAEIADREQILTVEERRVFNEALVEEIADHLRHRIHEVRGRVEQMNKVLERSLMAAGKKVQLGWEPLDDGQNTQHAALALLRRDVRHLGEDGRRDLVAFFRGRIETARREHGSAGEPKPMADTLMDAFDYRKWFAFRLHEQTDAGRIRLDETPPRRRLGRGAVGADPPAAVRGRCGTVRRHPGAPPDHA